MGRGKTVVWIRLRIVMMGGTGWVGYRRIGEGRKSRVRGWKVHAWALGKGRIKTRWRYHQTLWRI